MWMLFFWLSWRESSPPAMDSKVLPELLATESRLQLESVVPDLKANLARLGLRQIGQPTLVNDLVPLQRLRSVVLLLAEQAHLVSPHRC
jgi:hypothetical protein